MHLNLKMNKRWALILISILSVFLISLSVFATGSIEELEDESESLEVELGNINEEILAVSEELDELNQMIELTESQMGKTLDDLAQSKLDEAEQYENMKVRIQYMYEAGNTTFLELLFSAESLADFVNKSDFINNVIEYDREMLLQLIAIREEIEFEEESLLDEQVALLDLQTQAELKYAELCEMADEIQMSIDEIEAEIAEIKAEEARLEAEAQAQAEEEARLEAEAQAQAEAEKEENNSGSSSGDSSGSTDGSSGGTTDSGDDYSASTSELDLLAALLDCEAGADYDARLAVATVIMNRVESSQFPNSIYNVIYASGQFSPTWTGKLDRVLASGASALSYEVAEDAINGARLSSVSNCYYFLYSGSTDRTGVNVGGNVFFTSW